MSQPTATDPPLTATRAVDDPRTLRALAHPLRMSLLGALRVEGPSTASRLADRLGESSGSTSYHLRQLAAAGFVEEVEGEGTGRERWWRALHRSTSWDEAELATRPGGRELAGELAARTVAQQRRMLAAHAAERDGLDDDWRVASSLNDVGLRLGPEDARELADELMAVLARWRDTREDPDQPVVHVLVDLFPLRAYPL
ncbi:ArsR/SmtB family transcription factor [Blastococcus xanthinilyticus]|uniref:ArsR family transcriptional regulator n=1 Tax=Blastococcus xanthinilyticus TaxID=1564164 RepID=A0A5S5CN92_9ACTN|nr:helix-turn-helix domain-containing protein [Blastococcus xanthinilyticus]TYP81268.1 ArsR family transcriptional regulator [Blastococcus xanthinilyticus]